MVSAQMLHDMIVMIVRAGSTSFGVCASNLGLYLKLEDEFFEYLYVCLSLLWSSLKLNSLHFRESIGTL